MTQAQQTQPHPNVLLPAAVGALAMAIAMTGALFAAGLVMLPTFEEAATSGVSAAVVQSGQDWEAQRHQQALTGVTASEIDMITLLEQMQRRDALKGATASDIGTITLREQMERRQSAAGAAATDDSRELTRPSGR